MRYNCWRHFQWWTSLTWIVILGCPQIVPGASGGVIYSPNFPWYYPNSVTCNWTITSWKNIKLNFTKFDLADYSFCYDYVEVKNHYGYQIGKYCGSQIPSSITSYGSIHVQFHSSYWTASSGFMAFYQIGDSFPTPHPTYWPTYWPTYPYGTTYPVTYSPSKASIYACNEYYPTSKFFLLSSFSKCKLVVELSYFVSSKYQLSQCIDSYSSISHCHRLDTSGSRCHAPLSKLFFYSSLLPRSSIISQLGSIVSHVC